MADVYSQGTNGSWWNGLVGQSARGRGWTLGCLLRAIRLQWSMLLFGSGPRPRSAAVLSVLWPCHPLHVHTRTPLRPHSLPAHTVLSCWRFPESFVEFLTERIDYHYISKYRKVIVFKFGWGIRLGRTVKNHTVLIVIKANIAFYYTFILMFQNFSKIQIKKPVLSVIFLFLSQFATNEIQVVK